jgi:hypothetical protein
MEPFGTTSPVSKSYAGLDYKELKSHSSLLSNERLAILFYMLDLNSMNLNTYFNENYLMRTKANLYQIYKNVRSLIRSNPHVRAALNIETKVNGVYTIDVAFDVADKMISYCMFHGFTYQKCYAIAIQLNNIEIVLRDVLQYFNYFFRPDWKQKPDVLIATEKYKQMADKLTVEKLKETIGEKNKIDFRHLGSADVEEIEYTQSEDEDDKIEDYEEEEDETGNN